MIPSQNSLVKIYLYNSFTDQGFVQLWTNDIVVLESLDRSAIGVFYPKDIFHYTIFKENKNDIAITDLKPKNKHKDHNSRVSELAELHKLRIQEERKRTQERLREFKQTGGNQVNYESPFRNRSIPILPNTTKED